MKKLCNQNTDLCQIKLYGKRIALIASTVAELLPIFYRT